MCYIQCLFAVNPSFGININTPDSVNILTPDGNVSLNQLLGSLTETQKRYYDLTTQIGIETLFNVAGSVDASGNLLDIQLQHTFPSVADAILAWKNITNNRDNSDNMLLPQTLMPLYLMADLDPTRPDPNFDGKVNERSESPIHKPLLDSNHITLHNFGPSGEEVFLEDFSGLNAMYSRLLKNTEMSIFRKSFGLGDVINGSHRKNLGSVRPSLCRDPGLINKRKDIPQPTNVLNQWQAAFWDWTSSLDNILTRLGLTGLQITNNTGLLTFSYSS